MEARAMKCVIVAAVLLLILPGLGSQSPAFAQGTKADYRFAVGSRDDVMPSGTVWLYSYSWYGLRSTKLADIKSGVAEISHGADVVRRALDPNPNTDAYVIALEFPQNVWFRTANISPDSIWKDWPRQLDRLGQPVSIPSGGTLLVLPKLTTRRVTLLHEDGRPVIGARLAVSLYLYDYNHCAVHTGLPVGTYVTDRSGTVQVEAPLVPLYLDGVPYFERDTDGPLGGGYGLATGLKVGAAVTETIRERWNFPGNSDLPARPFDLRVVDSAGAPLAGVSIQEMDLSEGCGLASGRAGETDSSGRVRLRLAPETIAGLALISRLAEQPRPLSTDELRELFDKGGLTIQW
jgi:hypothetical protein